MNQNNDMEPNFYIIFISALIPLIVGSIWYNPKVFGNVWMKSAEISEERAASGNMILIFGLTYVFSILIGFVLMNLGIHQLGVYQLLIDVPGFGEAGSEVQNIYDNFMDKYGMLHRGWWHGGVHGFLAAIAFALPIIAIIALFERRGWKYIGVHFGYWLITLIAMSAVICHFL